MTMAWIPLVAALILLLLFPRKAPVIVSSITLAVMAIAIYLMVDENIDTSREGKVSIQAEIDPENCTADMPLRVNIQNNSDATLSLFKWNIAVYRVGYTTDLNRTNRRHSPKFGLEKPLGAGQSTSFCYEIPKTREGYQNDELSFAAIDKQVAFGD